MSRHSANGASRHGAERLRPAPDSENRRSDLVRAHPGSDDTRANKHKSMHAQDNILERPTDPTERRRRETVRADIGRMRALSTPVWGALAGSVGLPERDVRDGHLGRPPCAGSMCPPGVGRLA